MTQPMPLSGPTSGKCSVCDSPLDENSSCRVCGAVFGATHRCPHCAAIAAIEPGPLLGRCKVCGGARVQLDDAATVRSGREAPLLIRAQRAGRRALALRLAALAAAGGAAFLLLLSTVVALVSDAGAGVAVGTVLGCLTLAVAIWLGRHGRGAAREQTEAQRQALLLAASDVVRSHGALPADELAKILHLPTERAELLLAELSLEDFAHARVDPAGTVGFSTERFRVDPPRPERYDPPTLAAGFQTVDPAAFGAPSPEAPPLLEPVDAPPRTPRLPTGRGNE